MSMDRALLTPGRGLIPIRTEPAEWLARSALVMPTPQDDDPNLPLSVEIGDMALLASVFVVLGAIVFAFA